MTRQALQRLIGDTESFMVNLSDGSALKLTRDDLLTNRTFRRAVKVQLGYEAPMLSRAEHELLIWSLLALSEAPVTAAA